MINKILTSCAVLTIAFTVPSVAQQRFTSADAAAKALIDSAAKHDSALLSTIFGPGGSVILTSGNPEQDKTEQAEFSQLAQTKYTLLADKRDPDRMILSIGEDDWPFPAPIVRSAGQWSFDATETGIEMRARRIGANELEAIEMCAVYVEAQLHYAPEDRDKDGVLEYASHMVSTPGRNDGLFSKTDADSLVPEGLAEATWDGGKKPTAPWHGYYFRILNAQGDHAPGGAHSYVVKNRLMGGFALIAWPAEYGKSGIQTFIVNQNGVIYQKDIDPQTVKAAATRYDPDSSWRPVE